MSSWSASRDEIGPASPPSSATPTWRSFLSAAPRFQATLIAALVIASIAYIDWRSADDVPLGFLYLVPMLVVGRVLRPWEILSVAALCTYLTECFDPFAWAFRTGVPRDSLYFIAFAAIGMFVYHSSRTRELLVRESSARRAAEQQLTALIETSPAAIVTTDLQGQIFSANEAAHDMLGVPDLAHANLTQFFPTLRMALLQSRRRPALRTVMEARGLRQAGDSFLAEVCFSTYTTEAGGRFTALILDSSEELRSREEAGLHQILLSSRIAVSAMSHEIRNICAAIAAVHRNMRAHGNLANDPDSEALGNLVVSLERLASVDVRSTPDRLGEVGLDLLLEDLRIVITPELEEHGIQLEWQVGADLPAVWADPTGLMQVFLNLTSNAIRVLQTHSEPRCLCIRTRYADGTLSVEIEDNGGGVRPDVELFHPFQTGAQQTGLGLYIARAFMRSFGGDLQHRHVQGGACFIVFLDAVKEATR